MNGAKVVARAWVDPGYRGRLLADGTAAIAELGFGGGEGAHMVVVANAPPSTTWWSARCARVTRGLSSASRLPGTRTRPTGPAWSASPGRCWPRWAVRIDDGVTSGMGPSAESATSSCPSDRRAPTR